MKTLLIDVQFALRRLAKSPWYSIVTVGMLGLGVATTLIMFAVLKGVVLSSLPYPDGERIVLLYADNPRQATTKASLSPEEAVRLSGEGAVPEFEAAGYYLWSGETLFRGDRPREVFSNYVSDGFFRAVGMPPLLGRWIDAGDVREGRNVAVISHAEWNRLFGGHPDAIGKLVEFTNGDPLEVIGVMPADFAFPSADVALWRPLPPGVLPGDAGARINARYLEGVARLASERPDSLRGRLDRLTETIHSEHGSDDSGWRLAWQPLSETLVGDVRGMLWGAFGIASLILLIACANVSILIGARQTLRRTEQSVMRALGASTIRLHRVVFAEIGLMSVVAVMGGLALAYFGVELVRRAAGDILPRVDSIGIDGGVVAFALGLVVVIPLVALVGGALRTREPPFAALRSGGKGLVANSSGGSRLMPSIGIGLSMVSLVAAAALAYSVSRLHTVDPGFDSTGVHALQLFRPGTAEPRRIFVDQVARNLAAIPGVENVQVTTAAPLSGIGASSVALRLPGQTESQSVTSAIRRVSPGYLELLRIPLLAGRMLENADHANSEPTAVVNASLARVLFGSATAVGETVVFRPGDGEERSYRIVGVSADVRNEGLRASPVPEILIPYAQEPSAAVTFLLRAPRPAEGFAEALAEAVWEVDPRQATTRQYSLQDEVADQTKVVRFFTRIITGFAVVSILLGALGIYAVATLQQQRRVGEFGLRLALGARPLALSAEIVRGTSLTILGGIALGTCGAWLGLKLLETQLYEIDAARVPLLLLGTVLMAATALLASVIPAMRASRVSPARALTEGS